MLLLRLYNQDITERRTEASYLSLQFFVSHYVYNTPGRKDVLLENRLEERETLKSCLKIPVL